MNIKCIAIDDEPLALDVLQHHARKVPSLDMKATFTNPILATEYLGNEKVDLVFLDIQMPELTGFEWLRTLQHKPLVIFSTAYPNYAVESYEIDALDYLLKPIPFERFLKSVHKVQQHLQRVETPLLEVNPASSMPPDFIFIKTEYKTVKIFIEDILFIESLKDYVVFHLKEEKIQSLLSIKAVEEFLNGEQFVRVHRSFIIALDKIVSIERTNIVIGKHVIPIGENYKEAFRALIENKRL